MAALLVLVAVLVVGGFALHYAKKASDANAAQQVRDTRKQILASVAKATVLVTQAEKVMNQVQDATAQVQKLTNQAQGDASTAQKQVSATQAEAQKQLAEAKATAAETNELLTQIEQTQKETAKQLDTISQQLAAIEKASAEPASTTTTTTG